MGVNLSHPRHRVATLVWPLLPTSRVDELRATVVEKGIVKGWASPVAKHPASRAVPERPPHALLDSRTALGDLWYEPDLLRVPWASVVAPSR